MLLRRMLSQEEASLSYIEYIMLFIVVKTVKLPDRSDIN